MNSIVHIQSWLYLFTSTIQSTLAPYWLHVGEYKWTCYEDDYNGWLRCDGRAISIAQHQALFAVIGHKFAPIGGSNTVPSGMFYLPDMRGRVMGAVGHGSSLSNRYIGQVVGDEVHTLSIQELPQHSHNGTSDTKGLHTHVTNAVGSSLGLLLANGVGTAITSDNDSNNGSEPNIMASPRTLVVDTAGAHSHAITTESIGSGRSHNIMQPTLYAGSVFIFGGVQRSRTGDVN
jgi:microcystin-dependent protein